jgi:hypothetical protein
VILAAALTLGSAAQARLGLTTNFVDVELEHVKTGRAYGVEAPGGAELRLSNPGDAVMDVHVRVEAPTADFLVQGYEPVPDLSWLKVSPAQTFRLKPGETRKIRVSLRLPKDSSLHGRHFQATFWSHSTGEGLGAGVRSRLRFSVQAPAPAVAARAPQSALSFRPDVLSVAGNEPANRLTSQGMVLSLFNSAQRDLEVKVRSLRPDRNEDMPAGYVPTPSADFLSPEAASVRVPAGGSRDIALRLALPTGNAHRGRRYAFLVKAEPDEKGIATAYSRVYVEVPEE